MSLSLERITYRSLDRFPEETDDERNITMNYRDFSTYLFRFDRPVPNSFELSRYLKERCAEGKIKVLDCGAGMGVALEDLLSSEFGSQIKKVTGVSLHSFQHVKKVLIAHKNKIEWYLGDAITILNKLPAEYDLLTDYNGSYMYCEERLKLIQAMHGVLKLGGRAYILMSGDNIIDEDGNREKMEKYLAEKYSQTFKYCSREGETSVLIITKTSQRCPPINFELVYSHYRSTVRYATRAEAVKGNSWSPRKVIFKRTSSSRSLRTLECEPEIKRVKLRIPK